jgi:hypothetical protein
MFARFSILHSEMPLARALPLQGEGREVYVMAP